MARKKTRKLARQPKARKLSGGRDFTPMAWFSPASRLGASYWPGSHLDGVVFPGQPAERF